MATQKTDNFHHPLQSKEWGEFRERTGIKVIRTNNFQLTIHPIPKIGLTIGYYPKGPMPTSSVITELKQAGKKNNCVFIQLEPEVEAEKNVGKKLLTLGLKPSAHPLFTKYTFVLDLAKSEEELLKNMHNKTRYNIRLAERKGVTVKEENSEEAFAKYIKLTKETTTRQGFFAHTEKYHRLMWETLRVKNAEFRMQKNYDKLTAHLFVAQYEGEPLVAWILFVYKDTLYYPYGASSNKHREVMASNLMMWEAIKFGKKLGLKKFDMWGALGENPDEHDPWFGFHKFKQGYGARHVEFVGSYDLVLGPIAYQFYVVADKLRWLFLKIRR